MWIKWDGGFWHIANGEETLCGYYTSDDHPDVYGQIETPQNDLCGFCLDRLDGINNVFCNHTGIDSFSFERILNRARNYRIGMEEYANSNLSWVLDSLGNICILGAYSPREIEDVPFVPERVLPFVQ